MTRKYLNALAAALRDTDASRETIEAVADAIAPSNPNFNRARFISAASPA